VLRCVARRFPIYFSFGTACSLQHIARGRVESCSWLEEFLASCISHMMLEHAANTDGVRALLSRPPPAAAL